MRMLYTAHKKPESDRTLSLPGNSIRKVLLQLRSAMATKHCSTNTFVLGTVAKRHRDALSLIGIEKLPKTLCRK